MPASLVAVAFNEGGHLRLLQKQPFIRLFLFIFSQFLFLSPLIH